MPSLSKRKKRLAAAHHPAIAAAIQQNYEFPSSDDAKAVLKAIARQFLTHDEKPDELILWIGDFALTPEEQAAGYKGHFARLHIRKHKRIFTLAVEKQWLPLTRHPNRQRPHYPHPDIRHPLIRSIVTGDIYDRAEDAFAILSALHAQFPRTTIPGTGKLHLALYSKSTKNEQGEKTQAITKYLLEVISTPEGTFTIRMTAKPQRPIRKRTKKPPAKDNTPPPTGFFSARESLKRIRKSLKSS
jgi:hypothetical protein